MSVPTSKTKCAPHPVPKWRRLETFFLSQSTPGSFSLYISLSLTVSFSTCVLTGEKQQAKRPQVAYLERHDRRLRADGRRLKQAAPSRALYMRTTTPLHLVASFLDTWAHSGGLRADYMDWVYSDSARTFTRVDSRALLPSRIVATSYICCGGGGPRACASRPPVRR